MILKWEDTLYSDSLPNLKKQFDRIQYSKLVVPKLVVVYIRHAPDIAMYIIETDEFDVEHKYWGEAILQQAKKHVNILIIEYLKQMKYKIVDCIKELENDNS